MTEQWPPTLPLPTTENYSIRPGEAILRTEMEAGPARQRRRFTQVPSRITVRWLMTDKQFSLFEGWYKHKAKEGGEWFYVDVKVGLGLLPAEARFTRQFDAQLFRRVKWEITSELEIRERPTLNEGEVDLLIQEDLAGLIAASEAFHVLVHVTLPVNRSW